MPASKPKKRRAPVTAGAIAFCDLLIEMGVPKSVIREMAATPKSKRVTGATIKRKRARRA